MSTRRRRTAIGVAVSILAGLQAIDLGRAQQRNIRVVVVTKGLSHPWSLAFLPDGSMLNTEENEAALLRIEPGA